VVRVFVFGSNLAGRHSKGAALFALQKHGAVYGKGEGIQGRSYAIPTKDAKLNSLPLSEIVTHVQKFLDYAQYHKSVTYLLTPIGCGLAGYKYSDIAPMFKDAPKNVELPKEFQ